MDFYRVLTSFGFTDLRLIGLGSFGKVMLASSERYPSKVAIKIMDPTTKRKGIVSTCLDREVAILKTVRHPHIVQVHEIYQMPEGQTFIVMEATVTDLRKKVQKLGCIPITWAKQWFSQLLSAMVYLHQQDIAHRDLKCGNVLLTADHQVKLADFGIGCFSKGFPDLTGTVCGTPVYCAPEVRKGKPYDPKKSDVWSLGVILYIMVTGKMPFNGRGSLHPITYPSGNQVDEDCRAFISYMLQYDPQTRPSMEEVAQHPWLQSTQVKLQSDFSAQQNGQSENTPETHSSANGETTRRQGTYVVKTNNENEVHSFIEDISTLQEDDSSRAGAIPTCQTEEVVEGEYRRQLGAALKQAARTVVAPILKASGFLQKKMKFFKRKTVVHDFSSAQQDSAASTQVPASSKKKCEERTYVIFRGAVIKKDDVEAKPRAKEMTKKGINMLKVLKKRSNRIHPL